MEPIRGTLMCTTGKQASRNGHHSWTSWALGIIEGDNCRSADTHLVKAKFAGLRGISVYFKDESTHPTGSLKHRLARSLFLYSICNGWIREGTTIIEASSGSTAVSEAYFADLLNLPFIAVMSRSTSPEKIDAIVRLGGKCHFVDDAATIYAVAESLALQCGGHYLDQFTNAERATDWRGNNNIAESIFSQLAREADPEPTWIVTNAGTGGTSATIGRYIRYRHSTARLCVVDAEYSAFYTCYCTGDMAATCASPSRVEGIGRPRVEPSFLPAVIDHMIKVPDAASLAAMHVLSERLGRRVGGSTGTNFHGVCQLAAEMIVKNQTGSIVSIICDCGDRYASTYYNPEWLAEAKIDIAPWVERLNRFLDGGPLTEIG